MLVLHAKSGTDPEINQGVAGLVFKLSYSGKISRTINFTVSEDSTTTSKINSSKSYYSIQSYDIL